MAAILIVARRAGSRSRRWSRRLFEFRCHACSFHGFDRNPRLDFNSSARSLFQADWGIHLAFGVDGLSLLMLLLAAIVSRRPIWLPVRSKLTKAPFTPACSFISAGAIGAFASSDLFFFYAFHELALIPTFLLIGIWGTGNRSRAAWKITIYLTVGSFILLIGLILPLPKFAAQRRGASIFVSYKIGSRRQQNRARGSADIYILLLIGFGILISLFPFHSWAPEAYASAPSPAAMLHAGVLKKFGSVRFASVGHPAIARWRALLEQSPGRFYCSATLFTSAW